MERTVLLVHNTVTGDFIADLSHLLAGGSGTDQIVGFGDATIQLSGAAEVKKGQRTGAQAWAMLEPNLVEVTLATADDTGRITAIMFSGVVLDVNWSDETGLIEVYAEQIRTLMQNRMTFGVFNHHEGDFKVKNVSREAAIRAILTRATEWGGNWPLPLDLPTGGAGGFSADVSRWDITTIEDLIVQLEKYGSEVRFAPYLTSALQLRHTVTVAPRIIGATTVVSVTAPRSPLRKYTAGKNGTRQVTGTFVTGKGMGSKIPYAGAGNAAGPPIPVRDSYRAASDISDQAVLQSYATADLAADRSPRVSVAFEIVPNERYPYLLFAPSRVLTVERHKHPVLPDDSTDYRVTQLRFDLSTDVLTPTLEVL